MNKNLIIIAVIIVVVVGGFVLLQGQQGSQTPQQTPVQESTTQEKQATDEGTAMEKEEATGDAMMTKTVVETKNFAFVNKTYTAKAGETVTFKNLDVAGHSVTSDDGKSFDTGVVGKDQTATFKAPAKAGSYPFHCTPHPNMKATLVVE